MTIAQRLIILLTLPLAALVAMGIFTRVQLTKIETRTRFIAESRIEALATLGNLSRSFAEMEVSVRSFLLSATPRQQTSAQLSFDSHEREVGRLLRHYADHLAVSEQGRRLLRQCESLSREWAAAARQVMTLAIGGRRDEAIALLNGRVAQVGDELSAVSTEWIHNNEELAARAGREALQATQDSRSNMLVGNSAALLLTALLGFLTFMRIVKPIRGLEASVKVVAEGDYSAPVPFIRATDEIGGLARSIDILKRGAAAMDEQRWVKSNESRLTADLQGATSLSEFGDRLVSGVVPMIGGGIAAFYLFDASSARLSRVASYGLLHEAQPANALSEGDGLAGECARQRKRVTLTNLPPRYLHVGSALGGSPPVQAIALPLLSKDTLLGVMELASLRAFTPRENALLDEVLPIAALSLEILQRNVRTVELLGQTQTQARKLEEQTAKLSESQEELLAQKEELIAQQARLAASEERSRLILESSAEGIFGTDIEGRITFVNPATCRLLGFAADELVGQPSHATFHQHHPDGTPYPMEDCPMYAAYKHGKSSRIEDEVLWRKDGSGLAVEYGATPMLKDRQIVGSVISFTDITERKSAEAALNRSSQELQRINFKADTALDLTKAGYWHVPLDNSGWYNSSERAARIFGDPPAPNHRYTLEHWAEHVRAGDEAAAKATAENFAAAVAGEIPVYDATYAYKRPIDGQIVWIHALGHVVKDAAGKPTDMFGVTQDITAFKAMESELRAAMQKAEEATKAKSAFLANMSHEIRTPMNGIIGMTELALDTELTAEQRDYLNTVKWSADALLTLINDILDFSKIEAGRIELDPIEFLLRDAISDTLNPLAQRASSKGLELVYDIAPDVPDALTADVYRLRQVIVNLVGNAIKFTDKGEVVVAVRVVEADDERRTLEFSVRDTGIGIAPAAAAKLFKPFAQADAATTRKYGGTGLGLAISRQLVALMGGQIRLESEPGRGSNLVFTVDAKVGTARSAVTADDAAQVLSGKVALIVDDNETNRRILVTMLSHWGMRTVATDSGAEALATLDRSLNAGQSVALLITDLHMPEMDGFDLIAALRRHAAFATLPVMLLTSSAAPGDQKRAEELSVAARLLKPVKQSLLLDNLMRIMVGTGHDNSARTSPQSTPSLLESGDGTPLRVLLAEDNPVNVKFALKLLERAGHHVIVAGDGKQAVELWQSDPFDLVLMDVQMPEMDGLEATQLIRRLESACGRHTPIIAMTANAMAGDREMCLDAGMDGYVAKPVKKDALFAEIARLTAKGGQHVAGV